MKNTIDNKEKKFLHRWRIEGTLFTCSALHVGSGETITHPELVQDNGDDIEISAVTKDHQGMPYIPGSTLKGCLRSFLEQQENNPEYPKIRKHVENLFGRDADAKTDDLGQGGKTEFHDAYLLSTRKECHQFPFWTDDRQTFVDTMNSINRETGAAAENHLIHQECVPPGAIFKMVVTGRMEEEEAFFLMDVMNTFTTSEQPLVLGADKESNKGQLRWEHKKICRADIDAVKTWLKTPDRGMPEKIMTTVSPDFDSLNLRHPEPSWKFDITLRFDGPFLVNDPPGKSARDKMKADEKEKPRPDLQARTDENGRPLLPAKSFRGVFRTQAEKILRTMAEEYTSASADQINTHIACRPEIHNYRCSPLTDGKQPEDNLCLACQVFGAAGWGTTISVSDFTEDASAHQAPSLTQEFVAIDRFTGGGADKKKFNAQGFVAPVLTGHITLDKVRLDKEWPLALLALVLRDLKEGDMAFGYGAARGYGQCKADIPSWTDVNFRERVKEGLDELERMIKKTCREI